MSEPFEYVGDELEVFAGAIHWKRYFESQLRTFIRGNVLEVGAGLGGTTKVLCQGAIDSWTCLEPDAKLADRLRAEIAHDASLCARPIQVTTGTIAEVPAGTLFSMPSCTSTYSNTSKMITRRCLQRQSIFHVVVT
jgi:16S rRNA A1518/A1519 N6-dimethyltransferase RsmA/KsgA/DIM1 with predicted DNA glycosylase/AP lyase activity